MKNICLAPIVSLDFLAKERPKMDKVVLAGGGFDILHEGHIHHLQRAKSLGNILIVHITGDKRIKEKKGEKRPIFNERKRALVVSSLKFVDYVFIYDGRHYDKEVIEKIKPDILFFNQESIDTDEVKKINFEGQIIISKQTKLDSSSRAIKEIGHGSYARIDRFSESDV